MLSVLVIANQTAIGPHITQYLYDVRGDDDLSVFVMVPASPLAKTELASGDGLQRPAAARRAAQRRLTAAVRSIAAIGADVRGAVGPADPMRAAWEALEAQTFDRVLLSTLPPGTSRWLAMDLPHRLQRRLPIPVDHVIGPPAAEPGQIEPVQGPVRILLVDDQPAEAAVCERALRDSETPVDIQVAKDGAEAIAALRAQGPRSFDVVLLDLQMPGGDGYGFLQELGREFDLAQSNVVVLSSSVHEKDRERAHALGAGAYLIKEADYEQLAATLHSVVSEIASGWRFSI